MKIFVTFILTFSLTLTSFGPHYSLYAQTDPSEITTKEQGVVYQEEIDKKSTGEKVGEISMTTLLMFATVLLGPFFAIACPTKPSAIMFSAGAVFFIGQEIYNWSSYKSASDRAMKIYDNSKEADKQMTALQAAGEQTLEAANKASLKGNFLMAISITWGVASAVAFIEGALAIFKPDDFGPCKGPPVALFEGREHEEWVDKNLLKKSPPLRKLAEALSGGRDDLESFVLLEEQTRFFQGEVKSLEVDKYEKMKNFNLLPKTKLTKNLSELLVLAMDLIVPKAHAEEEEDKSNKDTNDPDNVAAMASGISMGITGGVLAAVLAKTTAITATLKAAWANPFARGGAFAAFAGFAGGTTALVKKGAGKLEKQANQYFNLMQQLQQANSQITATTGINQSAQAPIIRSMSAAMAAQSLNGQCFTGGVGKVRTDPSCSCQNSKSCKKSGMPTISFEGFQTPTTMKNIVDSNGQIMDQYYKGNIEGANLLAEANNNRNAARLKKLNKSIRGNVNRLLKQSGKKPYDFDKEIADQKSFLASNLKSDYNNLSSDLKGKVFSFDKDKKIMDKKEPQSKRGAAGVAKAKAPPPSKGVTKPKAKGGDFKFDFDMEDEEEQKKGLGHTEDKAIEKELDQYETDQDDVSQRSETSLFKIIETRYLKTAYPIFFEEEK